MENHIYSGVLNYYKEQALKEVEKADIATYKVVDGKFYLLVNTNLSFQEYLNKVDALSTAFSDKYKLAENHEGKEILLAGVKLLSLMKSFIIIDVKTYNIDGNNTIEGITLNTLKEGFSKFDSFCSLNDDKLYCYAGDESIEGIADFINRSDDDCAFLLWGQYCHLGKKDSKAKYREVNV